MIPHFYSSLVTLLLSQYCVRRLCTEALELALQRLGFLDATEMTVNEAILVHRRLRGTGIFTVESV